MIYKNLSLDMIKNSLEEFYEFSPKREMVIHTGAAGAKMFDDAIFDEAVRKPLRDDCTFLYDQKVITTEEHYNLNKMISSPDRENLEIAKIIINQNKVRHGSII